MKKLANRLKKVSSIDILGIFALFFVASTVFFFFSRKSEYITITIRLLNQEMPEHILDFAQPKSWYIEKIKVGKTTRSGLGEVLIEVSDVYSYPNGYVYNDTYVTLKIKSTQNRVTKQYIYEGNPILIHDIRSFKVGDVLISGEIIDINKQQPQLKKLKVSFELQSREVLESIENNSNAEIKGVDNHVANMVDEGMTIKDSKGNEIIKITDVQKSPGEIITVSNLGLRRIYDPNRTQVTIETELLAEQINNFYYYRKEEPLIVDQKIYMTFDMVTLIGKITDIEIIE